MTYHPDIQKLQSRSPDYTGIHGHLIVDRLSDRLDPGNGKYWGCLCCKCGELKEVRADSLKRGATMCYDCKQNQRNTKPSVQQQAEFNRGKYLPNGEEV